jgi:Methyltransferase domain
VGRTIQVEIVEGTAERIETDDQVFDLVFMRGVLTHLKRDNLTRAMQGNSSSVLPVNSVCGVFLADP